MGNNVKVAAEKDTSSNGLMFRIDFRTWLWLGLFIFILITRFHHLGDKPFHHDESLYSKYIWNFHVGQGYQYDPMQHGPFMFHFSQLTLFLFGVSNYSVRILPALTGIVITLFLFFIRKWLPKDVALMAGWLCAINPVFMYFQRFMREDPFFTMWAILLVFFVYLWFIDRKPWQIYWASASLSMLVCTKENAFVQAFIIFSFGLLFTLVKAFEKTDGRRGGFRAIVQVIEEYSLPAKVMVFISIWGISFILYALGNQFLKSRVDNWDAVVHTYWIAVYAFAFVLIFYMVYLGERVRSNDVKSKIWGLNPSFFLDSHVFAVSMFIFIGIFVLLYTTLFTNLKGFWGGMYEWYTYWLHQHSIARIAGPFHYYHHLMLIYGFIPAVVTLVSVIIRGARRTAVFSAGYVIFFAVAYSIFEFKMAPIAHVTKKDLFTNGHLIIALGVLVAGIIIVLDYLKEKAYLKGFLIWWSMLAYLIYSYLQEKVPWLVMHILTPMIFFAAIQLVEVFQNKKSNFKWARLVVMNLFGLMIAYCLHTSIQLCWYHEADPTEQLVYVQTTYDVPKMIKEMEDLGFWTGEGTKLPMVITGHATWPFYWYLRDWTGVSYGQNVDTERHLIVICNWEDRHKFSEKLADKYVARRYGLRAWYLPKRQDLMKGNPWRNAFRWVVLRERFEPQLYGSQEICMFVRKDAAKFQYSVDIGQPPEAPKRKESPTSQSVTKQNILEIGGFGSTDGKFNSPKDIAVDTEGNVYVVDNKNHRIQKFDPTGKFLLAWGKNGKEDGQFDQPTGIFVDSRGEVYIADTWNHRIQKFDTNGNFKMKFGDSNLFWAPKKVVVDKDGFIYVVNTGYHRIQKFNRNGAEQWSVGTKGDGVNQFAEPVGLAIDNLGRLFVADTANQRVVVYDKDGHQVNTFQVFGWDYYYTEPYAAIDAQSELLYLTDSQSNRIQIFGLDGTFKSFWGKQGTANGEFGQPLGIAIGPDRVYITESQNNRVQIFTKDIL